MLLSGDWRTLLQAEFEADYYQALTSFLDNELANNKVIYPPVEDIFKALDLTSYKGVKVVILGQDPYHGPNQACGLCFSVNKGVPLPRSLINIYKELHNDLGCSIPGHGNLEKWARQGVLLLNTILTVRAGEPQSHRGAGWERLTDRIITLLNDKPQPVVYLLWGNNARAKKVLIDNPGHRIIASAHPSPLSASRGFFGSRPFSRANDFLKDNNLGVIDWQIDN